MENDTLTKAKVRACELRFDGLVDEEIATQLAVEGYKPRCRRTIGNWLGSPQCQELLARLERTAMDVAVKRRRKLQEVALTKTAMFLDGIGNTVNINGKTKTQEVKPEVVVQLLKVLMPQPADAPQEAAPPPKVEAKELSEVEVRAWFAARNLPFPADPVEEYDPTTAAPGNR